MLDPGHGGKDPGAVGKTGQEKTINLNVALAVGKLISEKYPDVKIVYTRTTDKYVTLQERPNIANEADGDLFIYYAIVSNSKQINAGEFADLPLPSEAALRAIGAKLAMSRVFSEKACDALLAAQMKSGKL